MKSKTTAIIAGLAIAAGGGLAFMLTRKHDAPAAVVPPSAATVAGSLLVASDRPDLGTAAEVPVPVAPVTPAPAPPPTAGEGVKVVRGATLATVNGVAISGADVVAFREKTAEALTLTPEMHEFLVRRAIERELTMQAARARKLELSATQREQLAQVRANAEQRGETDPAQLAFEEKEASAQMLLESMMTADGAPSAMVDDATIDAYLREHAAELGPTPREPDAAQQRRIELRQKLYAEQAAAHEAKLREYLAGLERDARVTR
jgi:hypothetical protein